jgi:hypothetical protein
MATVQVNPPGMTSTTPGYVSSVTVYTGGSAQALVPNATTGQITVDSVAATNLVVQWGGFKLISG